ncbi:MULTISPECIES: RNB domain-containing ribonuclease [unclassified Gordonia (in: high G+C Gram-positive bacteria)]|uniref:RNB domain-containing ribonuclease n=1 Tax=unclassified Gordonia (in: high G+C Gram-positive bacteria) TaxID=2657482 RepID=UPI001CFB540B|nr:MULTISPECIES: RNB domain-containing ribonuclease [unclassified Gordonia (in: high G+C Gram-positive bacteria)]MCT1354251.1 RNB domain-containing ribonuclease [Gordonia sp. p3-SID1431]UCZ91246.1 RNB domain-containing ribonuclease [Gordonia sp. WA4-43]
MKRILSAPDIDFAGIRTELGVDEEYGDDALAEARATAQMIDSGAPGADRYADVREDHTGVPFVTIDPPTSRDLDQAVHLTADGDGFVVDYAIADVAALITPEGALDQESRRRGATVYFPDGSVPLHPRALSEGAGSLLPEQVRLCVLWTIRVAGDGSVTDVRVRRSRIASVARLDYAGVSADAAAGRLHPAIAALPAFGELRREVALARGAVELDLPDQTVVRTADGWRLDLEAHTPADMWNSQVSLLAGMCAGTIMTEAGVGLLRTLPPAEEDAIEDLRAAARALGVQWPAGLPVGRFLAGLPGGEPSTLALQSAAAGLMRGANYLALTGPDEPVDDALMRHSAIGGLYAHVTAPLRRLGDRFATEVCLAIASGTPVPDWVHRALPTLPKILRSADTLGATADRASIDLAEAVILRERVGERFDAVVMSGATERRQAQIFLSDPPVVARCAGDLRPGDRVVVELTKADEVTRTVEFRRV